VRTEQVLGSTLMGLVAAVAGACGGSERSLAKNAAPYAARTSAASGGAGTGGGLADFSGTAGAEKKPRVRVNACGKLPEPGVWEQVTPPLQAPTASPQTIGVDPVHGGTVYVQIHTGGNGAHAPTDGLRVSKDCGATWQAIEGGRNATDAAGFNNIHRGSLVALIVDPYDPQMIYTISNYGPGGVWRSLNGGVDWDQLVPPDVAQYVNGLWFNGLTMDPNNHKHLMAVTHNGCTGPYAPNCVAETRDAGATWTLTKLPSGWKEGNGIYIIDDQTYIWQTGLDGLFVTKNGGKDFTNAFAGGCGAGMGNAAYKASDGKYYMASLYGIIRSGATDLLNWEVVHRGQFWNLIGTGKNMLASQFFGLRFFGASDADPTNWSALPALPPALQETGGVGKQPESPGHGALYLAYDVHHKVAYASNYWVMLRTVLP
jgi:hypothetical protein